MHAQMRAVGHLHLGHRAPHPLGELQPELADLGLGLGDGGPVVAHVLVFADDLAVMAAVALGHVDDEDFLGHGYLPSATHALKRRPEAGSYSLAKASGIVPLHSSICAMLTLSTSAR